MKSIEEGIPLDINPGSKVTVITPKKNELFNDYHPVVKAFLAGSFSGTCSTILFQPLDLVKTRLQNSTVHMQTTALGGRHSHGMINIFSNIVKQHQITGLWRGMMPSITRCVPGVGLYFSSLHWLKGTITEAQGKELSALQAVGLGVIARTFTGIILNPFSVIKTRFESGVYEYRSVLGALNHIWTVEGAKGLYCGLGATLARDAPFSGIYLMFYSKSKQSIPKEWLQSPTQASVLHFSCGIFAGVLASLITNPADVIKTRMQLYPDKYPTILSAVMYIHQHHGAAEYFKGVVPRMLRRTLMTAMAWTLYEQITRSIGLK